MLLGLVSLFVQHSGFDRRLVNIQTTARLVEYFHRRLLRRATQGCIDSESLPRVLFRKRQQSVVPKRIQGQTNLRARGAVEGHNLVRARLTQPNPIFIRRCVQTT